MKKNPERKDPRKYATAIEKGYEPAGIPPRPLFGRTLEEYRDTFVGKVNKVRQLMKDAWK